jgi:uncharacterized membrane protein
MGADARHFFTPAEQQRLVDAIGSAEERTTGEIRLHLENHAGKPVMDRAIEVFNRLNMHETAQGTGVLIYLAIKDRAFTILGDDAIHAKVGSGFWDDIKNCMEGSFRQGQFLQGLLQGIEEAGHALAKHFPKTPDNPNELSDEISFGA